MALSLTGLARRRGPSRSLPLVTALVLVAAFSSACSSGSGASSTTCPLTGQPAPGGKAPARAAVAVKVDNAPVVRPQTGLVEADVVFEEPVEGGLTRFVAVYQCQAAARIEPVRSARLVDPDLLAPLGAVGLAHAGGIQPALDKLGKSGVVDVGDARLPGAYHRDSSRSAPHNEYTSTAQLWPHLPGTPPSPLFTYAAKSPSGPAARQLHIPFSGYSNVTWRYDPGAHDYRRSYAGTGAASSGGRPTTADNIVVQQVALTDSGYVEDATGEHENNVGVVGSGAAAVYRDGVEVAGQWQRSSVGDVTTFADGNGNAIALRPGRTWVELVPSTVRTSS